MLGATPHEFESRILRHSSGRLTGPRFRRSDCGSGHSQSTKYNRPGRISDRAVFVVVSFVVSVGPSGRYLDPCRSVVLVAILRASWQIRNRPDQAADPVGDIAPDGLGHVLVASGHRRRRPVHDPHDRPLGYTEQQENRRGGMPRVRQAAISNPCIRQ